MDLVIKNCALTGCVLWWLCCVFWCSFLGCRLCRRRKFDLIFFEFFFFFPVSFWAIWIPQMVWVVSVVLSWENSFFVCNRRRIGTGECSSSFSRLFAACFFLCLIDERCVVTSFFFFFFLPSIRFLQALNVDIPSVTFGAQYGGTNHSYWKCMASCTQAQTRCESEGYLAVSRKNVKAELWA